MGFDYDGLKALARRLRRPLHSLIVLSDDNDPFFASRPGKRLDSAEWFARLWDELEIPHGSHLRRVHYLMVSTPGIMLPDGRSPYLNTEKCWKDLVNAGRDARYLELVDPEAFVDRRAPEPLIYEPEDVATPAQLYPCRVYRLPVEPREFEAEDVPGFSYLPNDYQMPRPPSAWLRPPKIVEPYAIELWCEKSTMNDVLEPIAHERGVSLVTGVGEMSATFCHAVARRAAERDRATRVFYLSDFDPAGQIMPVSVARKIEFELHRLSGEHDVRLIPLALTSEQVDRFELPRIPIKDEKRRAGFEELHGEGAVELDALEALHPGELARIVEDAIDVYREPTQQARREISSLANEIWNEIISINNAVKAEHAEEIAQVESEYDAAKADVAEHQQAIADAIAQCEATIGERKAAIAERLDRWREQAAPVWQRIADEVDERLPDLDDIEWPEVEPADEPEALYDSGRDYLDQVTHYKRHQGKG